MGNVSQLVPSIHAWVAIASREVALHSFGFASAACSEMGFRGLSDAAKAFAMNIVDLLADPDMIAQAKTEFERMRSRTADTEGV